MFRGLAPGTYYWSVQAVDASFAGSAFASEAIVTVCGYSIDPISAALPAAGGPGSVAVTASAADCGWTAVSNDAWITVDPGTASGTGAGTVNYTVAANPLSTSRAGTVTIGGQTFTVTQAGALVITSLEADRTFPFQADGVTAVTWTAVVSGGVAPLEYQFQRYSVATGLYTVVQNWGTSNTFVWTPTTAGRYFIGVYVRNAGATASQANRWTSGFDLTTAPPSITSLTADHAFPFPADGVTAVTWTAVVSGGVAPLEYQFQRYSVATGLYTVVQNWGTSNTFVWTPTTAGRYFIGVYVRNAGATASQANRWTSGFDLTTAPPSITSLTANQAFPFTADGVTSITWTAVASGGVAPLEYQFQRYSVATGLYTVVQNWGTSNTFVWTPTTAGRYFIGVYVRNAGATASQANRWTSGFDLTTAPPSITSLTADHAFPFPADGVTAITWTAVVSGGVAPLEYQFQRYSVATGLYTVVQNWGTSNTFVWTPTTAGRYFIGVYVRNAGATASQANRWTSGFDLTTAPPSITSLTADHAFPFPADGVTAVTWTAVVSGGVAPLEYQFQRYSVATGLYTVVQNWSTSSTFSWTPTTAEAGRYFIGVYVRNAGATASQVSRWTSGFNIQ